MGGVVYSLVRRPAGEGAGHYWHYWLLRQEGGETDTLASGAGLSTRLQVITYLREVAELGGPDASAALRALAGGWALATAEGGA